MCIGPRSMARWSMARWLMTRRSKASCPSSRNSRCRRHFRHNNHIQPRLQRRCYKLHKSLFIIRKYGSRGNRIQRRHQNTPIGRVDQPNRIGKTPPRLADRGARCQPVCRRKTRRRIDGKSPASLLYKECRAKGLDLGGIRKEIKPRIALLWRCAIICFCRFPIEICKGIICWNQE